MEDKSGNLTQALVDKLASSEVIKESTNFNKISENLNILSFDDFISRKSSIQEQIDMDALKTSLKSAPSSSKTSSKSTSSEGPFKSKEDGDSFRKWVNDKHADWAKENKLDVSGSHTNSFIMKAWNKFKDEYKPSGEEESAKKEEKVVKLEEGWDKIKSQMLNPKVWGESDGDSNSELEINKSDRLRFAIDVKDNIDINVNFVPDGGFWVEYGSGSDGRGKDQNKHGGKWSFNGEDFTAKLNDGTFEESDKDISKMIKKILKAKFEYHMQHYK
jgi:hypothetical protein